jgi:hypothetical protein
MVSSNEVCGFVLAANFGEGYAYSVCAIRTKGGGGVRSI